MKLKHLLPICALALPLWAQAVPAYPGLLPATMADGSQVMMRMHGDEFFSYTTDESGYLLTGNGKGRMDYMRDPNGARLKATPMLLEQMRLDAFEALDPAMQQTALSRGANVQAQEAAEGQQRIAAHDAGGRTTFPTLGDNHYLVLLVDYSDLQWTMADPISTMNEKLNGENYNYMGGMGSMRQYYIENSGGLLNPTFDIVGVVRMPNTNAYYVGNGKFDNVAELVLNACQIAETSYGVDFSKYDINDDGYIDNVIIFYPGYGAADIPDAIAQGGTLPCIWPHNSRVRGYNLKLGGKILDNYCCFNELNGGTHYTQKDLTLDGIGTPVHEFGHVLGLPDLYDPEYKVTATPGEWSVMDRGCYNGDGHIPCYYSIYERWCLRWTEYDLLDEPGNYTLDPVSANGKGLRQNVTTPAGSNITEEYYVFESRDLNKFDNKLPYGGMLIWHINYDRAKFSSENRVNSDFKNLRCHLITADGTASYALDNSKVATNAAWPRDINYITPDTKINLTPASMVSGKKPVPHYFTEISYDEATGKSTFEYDAITSTPQLTTVLHEPFMIENENGKRTNTLRLEWDAVPGADSYQLTMYRVSTSGTTFYEQFLEERNVGNVTSYDVNLSVNKLETEFHIFVRPVAKIPSKLTSNEWVVTPKNLEARSAGVEEIATEQAVVRGLKGAIDAPVGARVFTLTGAACGRDNLTPGLYLVTYAGKSYKVVVK